MTPLHDKWVGQLGRGWWLALVSDRTSPLVKKK